MRIGKQEKSLTYIFTPNKIKVNNTKQERTKKVQETRYKIIRIDEEDYGCEERPDDHVPMVSVLVKAIEPDDFGDFPERIIMMEDEIMYRRNLDEGEDCFRRGCFAMKSMTVKTIPRPICRENG